MKRLVPTAALAILLWPAQAHANGVGQVLQVVGAAVSFIPGFQGVGYAIYAAGTVYGGVEARRKRRRLVAQQKAELKASLQDRTITVLRSNPPHHVGYGRCVKGGEVLDLFTTDKVTRSELGVTVTRVDALKHLVILLNSRRSQAIHEVYIDGVPVGALDVNGYPTGGDFKFTKTDTRRVEFTGSVTLEEQPTFVINAYSWTGSGTDIVYTPQTVTIGTNSLSGPPGVLVAVDYLVDDVLPSVRISKHLGSDTEAVDPYFASIAPSRYTGAHGWRGFTAIGVTLDLEDARFQGGLPNITADGSWSLVYDPRKDSTVPGGSGSHRVNDPGTWEWSDNAALCTADHLRADTGFSAAADEVNLPKLIAAANVCDELISLTVGATTTPNQKRYTCNGAFTTDGNNAEAVLEDLAECMAGTVVYGADWSINAGAWTAPVMTLTDADLRGAVDVVQADTPTDSLFNGLRGQYIPAGAQSPTDINPPYQNTAFVAADGEPLWENVDLPFTDNPARARNLARIFTERVRAGQVLRAPVKMRAWPLQPGDRVTASFSEYGISALTYRVTDWDYDHTAAGGPVLTLQRDYAAIWDDADAAAALPAPNTDLPNPWTAPAITGLAATSGSTTVIKSDDGTVTARVVVSWNALSAVYVTEGGYIDVAYRATRSSSWRRLPPVAGTETSASIIDMPAGEVLVIEVRAVNRFGQPGAPAQIGHLVTGPSGLVVLTLRTQFVAGPVGYSTVT